MDWNGINLAEKVQSEPWLRDKIIKHIFTEKQLRQRWILTFCKNMGYHN